ncbi:structural maintenance of chromosomes protein 5 isoform X2 [Cryptotermes secundus]|uniref:structural maintenance of chromosomes protein 5 isoform X2 n=1 Tax=Cryptotermes secundus TaxID=105785 RepID=UPI000CD7AD4C|nr:structural maintenance of chromosomes protein 5 isoform X2 [Cryptotermes secundus]
MLEYVQPNSYIRTGCRAARIETELKNSGGNNYVITRTITEDGKSLWLLGSATATQKQIEDLVSKLNIQVDNLCQFLPQDKVADFSKMNPQLLLENTEKCIGPAEMFEHHMQLKDLHKQQVELEQNLKAMSERLQSEEQRNSRIQVEVANISEKRTLLHMLENLKQKRAWLAFDVKRSKLEEMKADKNNAVKDLAMCEKRYEPMEGILLATKAKVKELECSLGTVNADTSRKLTALKEMQESIEQTEDLIKDNIRECERRIQAEETRRNEVHSLFQQINNLQNILKGSNKESVNVLNAELDSVRKQLNEKADEINGLSHEREKHRDGLENIVHEIKIHEKDQEKILDVANQRLELLRLKQKDTYDAVLWLRENRNQFHHHIYEPMMLEINIANPSNAKYVENVISKRDLLAFTCEDKKDMNNFVNILRDQKNLKVNVLHSGSEHPSSSTFKPNVAIDNLRQFGFHTYLMDMISAPEAIMKYLCRMYQIQNIPVGDARTFTLFDKVPASVQCFFSENHFIVVRMSKYSGEKSTQTCDVPAPVYLAISKNVELLQKIQARLSSLNTDKQEKMKALEHVQRQIYSAEQKMEELRSKKHSLMERLEQLRTVQARLGAKQKQLQNLEQDKVDPVLERARCRKDTQRLVFKLTEQNMQLVEILKQYEESLIKNQILRLELENTREQSIKKENESRQLRQKCSDAKAMVLNIEEKLRETRTEVKRLFQEAKATTGGVGPLDAAFEQFSRVFHVLGDTEEELDREIQDTQAKADCLGEADETVMREYKIRKADIASLTASIQAKEIECEKLKEKMAETEGMWLPPLKKLVSQINKKYGECFARLGCVGEVALLTGQNENDYEQYGLRIKVKFRDQDLLQELTQNLQSGGERSVATAIYMISLQELTRVPFCCVDEINQGMDADNERMIFELLLTTSRRNDSAQYFLLTPKLLPSLFYDDIMKVHCIYNGPGALCSDNWNLSDIIARRKRLKQQ